MFKHRQYNTELWRELHRVDTNKQSQTHTVLTYQLSQVQLKATYKRAYITIHRPHSHSYRNNGTFARMNITFNRVPLQS